ncbi:hypothetical protein Mar181_0662 [Marinomonas posidonica IVIA-Po-181]|uniref:Uncharacterized protein n=2 Tax=Marinomonas TaxID=28253 RepID=F6D0Z5_MARPP|nr:hypothetical protein Mar181_0662 [Marinomonas posidonica IVIA-Po-181]
MRNCAYCSLLRRYFVGVVLMILTGTTYAAIERLSLATQVWPPYQTVNEKTGEIGGVAVERVQCALRLMNQPYEIVFMAWDRAQLMVQTGKMDGYFAGSKSTTRAAYAVPSAAVVTDDLSWFVLPNISFDIDDETQKYNLRYGAKFNTNKWLSLKQEGYNVIKKPRDADSLLQMLWQGEIDVALEYRYIFEYSMEKAGMPLSNFKRVSRGTLDQVVHFSKDFIRENPTFLDSFNASLTSCR